MYLTISARWGLTSLSISNESNFCRGSFCAKCTFGFWFCLSRVEKVNSIPLSTANKIGLLQRWKILRGILTRIQSSSVLSAKRDSYSSLNPQRNQIFNLSHTTSAHIKGHVTTRFFSTEGALFSASWKYPLYLLSPWGLGMMVNYRNTFLVD